MAVNHFLLLYNLREGRLERLERFETDVLRATAAYSELEGTYREREDHANFEIVLIGADSLETVKVTHSRYFETRDAVPF